jgi:SAM-dependent methyltransferase
VSRLLEQSRIAYGREVAEYGRAQGLQQPEREILARHAPRIRGGRILDLGVGAGRTTPHLLAISDRYVGVDNSAEMVAFAAARFPSTEMLVGDARDLPFADGAFDLVFFSFNGIDHGDHAERLEMLAEARRTLRPGGWFVFSSHNRDRNPPPTLRDRFRALGLGALSRPRRVRRVAAFTLRLLREQVRPANSIVGVEDHGDHAIVSEQGRGHLVTYYAISLERQLELLADLGFTLIEAFDLQGAPATSGCRDAWINYCCQRAAEP